MPVKLSEIKGLLIDKKICDRNCKHPHGYYDCDCNTFNKAIDEMSSRKIGLNRDKLAMTLRNFRNGHKGFPPAEWDYNLADEIIASESEIIEVK